MPTILRKELYCSYAHKRPSVIGYLHGYRCYVSKKTVSMEFGHVYMDDDMRQQHAANASQYVIRMDMPRRSEFESR